MSSVGALHSKNSLGGPLWFKESPSWGVLPMGLLGVPPRSLYARHGRALLGGGSPSPFPPRRPLALGARNRSGGRLSSVSLSAGSLSLRALLGVSSPPSSLWVFPVAPWPSSAGAGPALTGPPTDAAVAMPENCAVGYPAQPVLFSVTVSAPWPSFSGTGPALTWPPTDAPLATPVNFSVRCPALPALSSVSVSASASFLPVAPCRAAPSLP